MSGIDWPGLLKWSMKYQDGTSVKPKMKKEDIEFFQKAMKEYMETCEDPNRLVVEAVAQLAEPEKNIKITALSVIERCLDEYPETARYLPQYNAIVPVTECVSHPDDDIKNGALSIISNSAPNNPKTQDAFLQSDCLNKLLSCLSTTSSSSLRIKCMGAIGGLVRHNSTGETQFMERGGFPILVQSMNDDTNIKLRQKSCLLAYHLVLTKIVTFDVVASTNLVKVLDKILRDRRLEEGAIQYGETMVEFTIAILECYRNKLYEKEPASLKILQLAIDFRKTMLQTLKSEIHSPDDFSNEVLLLTRAREIISV